jgi:hypothetical protein
MLDFLTIRIADTKITSTVLLAALCNPSIIHNDRVYALQRFAGSVP